MHVSSEYPSLKDGQGVNWSQKLSWAHHTVWSTPRLKSEPNPILGVPWKKGQRTGVILECSETKLLFIPLENLELFKYHNCLVRHLNLSILNF